MHRLSCKPRRNRWLLAPDRSSQAILSVGQPVLEATILQNDPTPLPSCEVGPPERALAHLEPPPRGTARRPANPFGERKFARWTLARLARNEKFPQRFGVATFGVIHFQFVSF